MRTIVAGSRTIDDYNLVDQAIKRSGFVITTMITGGAQGVDATAWQWATDHSIENVVLFAQWTMYGNRAGPLRNRQMADIADACIAIWDGQSKGTKDMIAVAKQRKLQLFVHRTDIKPIQL